MIALSVDRSRDPQNRRIDKAYLHLFKKIGLSYGEFEQFKLSDNCTFFFDFLNLYLAYFQLTTVAYFITQMFSVRLAGWGNFILFCKDLSTSKYFYIKIASTEYENLTEKLYNTNNDNCSDPNWVNSVISIRR